MNKSLKLLLAFILGLVILNIILTIYGKYHNQSAIRKIGQAERRIDTAFRAIGRAEILIDSMLRRAQESQQLLESIDMQVDGIRSRYEQDLNASRRNIEKLKQQSQRDREQLQTLQEELKRMGQ